MRVCQEYRRRGFRDQVLVELRLPMVVFLSKRGLRMWVDSSSSEGKTGRQTTDQGWMLAESNNCALSR